MTDRQAGIDPTTEVGDPVPSAAGSRHPVAQVVAMAVAMLLGSVGWYFLTPDRNDAIIPAGVLPAIFAVAMFGIAEFAVFNFHFRRHGISCNLSEIPLAIALVFLDPAAAIFARIPGALPVLVFVRRNEPYKLLFNLSLAVFEMALTTLIFRRLLGLMGESDTALLIAAALALLVVSPLGSLVISFAISRFEGAVRSRIGDELVATWWMYAVNVVFGVMVVSLMMVEPVLGLLAILPVAGVWYVLRSFGGLSQVLRDLDLVHGFAGRIGASLDVAEIAAAATSEMTSSFRAHGAALVMFTDLPAPTYLHGSVGVELPDRADDPRWIDLIAGGHQIVPAEQLRAHGIPIGGDVESLMLGPISDDTGMSALAVVVQDPSYGHEFAHSDVDRLRNLTQQLALSLRRGMLHERLEYEARHDALTDLPARTMFERAVDNVIVTPGSGSWSVLMIDLDRFKEVNDALGHHAGDSLLVEFSRRMSNLIGSSGQLARLAGDEFAVLVNGDADRAAELAQEVVRVAGTPVTLDGLEIVVTASVGVAEITPEDRRAVSPIRRADIAMYNAKWQRSGVELYRDEIDRRTPGRLSMLGDLRTAIENHDLAVVYQPKLDLVLDEVVGAEALVRWTHPTRGVVAPSEFVRVAEDTGLIKELTDHVLGRSISALRSFQDAGLGLGLAVNLSTHDLFDARLPDRIRSHLESSGVAPSLVTLEITESSLLVDAPRTRATIDDLHDVGLLLAVDDFGTGYSSLNYLRRLPVQELKIDQSFVTGMAREPQDEVIVRSTIELGHNLGLRVVAEGVENRNVLDRLRRIHCDVVQGYMISPPMSADELIGWVTTRRRSRSAAVGDRAVG